MLSESDAHKIDKEWVEGIRKGWKALVKGVDKFPGRVVADGNSMTQETITTAVNGAIRYVRRVLDWLDRLKQDLLVNKGLWSLAKDPATLFDKAGVSRVEVAEKLLTELEAAESEMRDVVWYAMKFATDPNHFDMFRSQKDFDFGIRGIGNRVESTIEEVDKRVSGKLLRFLTTVLSKSSVGTLGSDEIVPNEVSIGKLKVFFYDTPLKLKLLSPEKYKAGEVRGLRGRKDFLESIFKAKTLIDKRKLGFLWYGSIVILPHAKVDIAAYKATKDYANITDISATYSRGSDTLRVYDNDLRISTVIHELGHRFYYKFLTSKGRDHFDKFFGQVAPTSSYGGTNAAEDFAEVFAAYVRGKDLTRDQIDRFKSVLDTSGHRTESLRVCRAIIETN